jgi:phage gpG-like protein
VAVTVRVQIAETELRRQLTGPSGLATRHVLRLTERIANRARILCPVDTGNLRASITTAVRMQGDQVIGLVGTPVVYALPLHEGYRTSRGRKVPGRPFLRRAMTEVLGAG